MSTGSKTGAAITGRRDWRRSRYVIPSRLARPQAVVESTRPASPSTSYTLGDPTMRVLRFVSVALGAAASVALLSGAASAATVHPLSVISDRRRKVILAPVTNGR